mmetsp:Transcript_29111/g.70300  ORF Transcript_29111/g.70300 Transcript_29111/m.70300 type:complete len:107 (-) Transcript_29111:296-616(-)
MEQPRLSANGDEDVLMPFLVALKKHLESVQVLLGEIEDWIMEHRATLEFIEATFDVSLLDWEWDSYQKQLKTCQDNSVCSISFSISKESERTRLVKFLDFVSSPGL